MKDADIQRINELSRLARQRPLTEEEAAERARLRAAYIADVRASLQQQLDHTTIVYPDGSREKLQQKKTIQHSNYIQ